MRQLLQYSKYERNFIMNMNDRIKEKAIPVQKVITLNTICCKYSSFKRTRINNCKTNSQIRFIISFK